MKATEPFLRQMHMFITFAVKLGGQDAQLTLGIEGMGYDVQDHVDLIPGPKSLMKVLEYFIMPVADDAKRTIFKERRDQT